MQGLSDILISHIRRKTGRLQQLTGSAKRWSGFSARRLRLHLMADRLNYGADRHTANLPDTVGTAVAGCSIDHVLSNHEQLSFLDLLVPIIGIAFASLAASTGDTPFPETRGLEAEAV
ncbi:hypothetical protein MHYP_G00311360 [Metynnis hypsauchen]